MTKTIPLTQGYEALVDDEDYEYLSKHKWHARRVHKSIYAVRVQSSPRPATIYMHRVVMGSPENMEIDHINGEGVDNRKENLRVVTHQQNMRNQRLRADNSSGYRGVSWRKDRGKWEARISDGERYRSLGSFHTKEEAALAYNRSAEMLYGEFAQLNQVP